MNPGNMVISSQIVNLISGVIFLEDLYKYVNMTGDFVVISVLTAMFFHWAFEQHAQELFIPLDFLVKKYMPLYMKIRVIFSSISHIESFLSFIQMVVQHGQILFVSPSSTSYFQ